MPYLPPSIWYGKKWIPGTWLPGWQLAVFQSPRLHGCGPADAHGNAQPFCMDKCTVSSGKNACFAIWPRVGICPIISYLWMVDLVMRFFSCGASLWRSSTSIQSKKVQPLEFYFWHVRLGLLKSPFLVGEAEHVCLYPFARTTVFSAKKHVFCNLGARWHKILEFVPSCPICGWLAWRCDFFLWANLWRLSASIQSKKGPAPWILFLTPAPRPLQVTFLVGEAEHVCLYPFAGTNVFSEKKRLFCNLGALTQNSWIRPIMSYLWMIGLEMRLFSCGPTFEDYPLVFSQKKVQPLGFYFWHLRLGLFKSLFWLVKLNMCVCTLLQGQLYFQQKNMCFAIWARVDTKFLNSSHHVLSVDDWPGDATFFPVGPTFEDHPKYSVKKGPAPWILFLTRAPRPLEVTFFCWWRWTYVVVPFCKVM